MRQLITGSIEQTLPALWCHRAAVAEWQSGPGPSRDLWIGNVSVNSWTPDGEIVVTQFGSDTESEMVSLWSVSPAGGTPRSLGIELPGLRNVCVHPNGRQVVLTSGFPGSELWALHNFLPVRQ